MRRCIVCTCVVIQNRTNRVGGVVINVFLPFVVGRGLSVTRFPIQIVLSKFR
jgi:hypothetical protein